MDNETWVVCVVVLESKNPRTYKNYYLGCNSEATAIEQQRLIAKKGFVGEEKRRYFPDEIETVTLKRGEQPDEVS